MPWPYGVYMGVPTRNPYSIVICEADKSWVQNFDAFKLHAHMVSTLNQYAPHMGAICKCYWGHLLCSL